jgi:low temperature requirement protein LtrA
MATLERLLEPPRLRTLDADEVERRATWLELFFDLVFVAAIAQVGQNLTEDPSLEGFLRYAALFVAIWWAWMGYTFYADRFDTDDLLYRLLTLGGMLAIAALAVNVRDAFDRWTAFVISYALVRAVLLVLYVRARRHVPQARRLTEIYLAMFSLGVVLWLASTLVASPARYWIWAAGLVVELAAPLFGWRAIRQAPVHRSHIPERFGLFTIIVLGEAVLAAVVGTSGVTWRFDSGLFAAAAFVIAACLWWIHFDFVDTSVLGRGLGGLVYVYGHYPLVLGIAAFGVGTKLAIHETPAGELDAGARWLFCGGIALALLAMGAVQLAGARTLRDPDLWLRLGSGAAMLLFAAVFASVSPLVIAGLVAAVLVAQVAVEIAGHEAHGLSA